MPETGNAHFCRKRLPQCDTPRIRAISIRHHWKTAHPNEDTSCAAVHSNRKENRRENPDAEPALTAGNKKKAANMSKDTLLNVTCLEVATPLCLSSHIGPLGLRTLLVRQTKQALSSLALTAGDLGITEFLLSNAV